MDTKTEVVPLFLAHHLVDCELIVYLKQKKCHCFHDLDLSAQGD